ncbi:hypothetical protein Fmac_024834 [Flemingia macrophylla]|uniref:Uncharacterized protein n=1 Tax=Flemingia macrophylla TaxID=520843 RepID=A0ABD1LQL5_9FABA
MHGISPLRQATINARSKAFNIRSIALNEDVQKLEDDLMDIFPPTGRFKQAATFGARNDAIVIGGVPDVATDTCAETRKVESKLDAHVNLVTQLAVNQKSAYVARVCGIRSSNDHHTNERWLPTTSIFSERNDVIVNRGVHDVATDTSAETRKVEGKLDALVNLVTQTNRESKLPLLQESVASAITAAEARHLIEKMASDSPSSFSARNDVIVIRGVHDVFTDTSAETRKVEGKLDALVNLVTQLAVNQKPASVA